MRRILTTTASVIALAAVLANPAKAELEVTVGGFTAFQAAAFNNDVIEGTNRDFQSEAEIRVNADATADNGLQYGAEMALNASTSDSANAKSTSVYLAGGWGRFEMGDKQGASELVVFAPTVGIGQINGSYDDYLDAPAHMLNDRGNHNFTAFDSDYSTKATYYTPKYMGLQAGVSYAPEYQSITALGTTFPGGTGENITLQKNSSVASDIWEAGLGYQGEFSGVMFKAGGNYTHADTIDGVGLEDVSAWSIGMQLGYQGFRLGGGYTDNGDSLQFSGLADNESSSWNVGATYENGPWGVGISYLDMNFGENAFDLVSGLDGSDYKVISGGATYMVAPGLSVGADLSFYDRKNWDDGYVFVTDVTASF